MIIKKNEKQSDRIYIKIDGFGNESITNFEDIYSRDRFKIKIQPKANITEINIKTIDEYISDQYGNDIFIATSDAYIENGEYAIKVKDQKEYIFIGYSWKELGTYLKIKNNITEDEYKQAIIKKLIELDDDGLLIIKKFTDSFLKTIHKSKTPTKALIQLFSSLIQVDKGEILLKKRERGQLFFIFKNIIDLFCVNE